VTKITVVDPRKPVSARPGTAIGVGPHRPLRKDAERNRERILEAARELFAERGLAVSLNDIAHHAGVGVGTVYRRFPDKSGLIDDLFEERLEAMVALVDEALADADPWHGLTTFIANVLEIQAADRGLRDLICDMPDGLQRVAEVRNRIVPRASELIRRAQATGDVRPDIAAQDLAVMLLMMSTLIDAAREVEPGLWRRYAAMLVRGMAARPDSLPPLPVAPLDLEQLDRVMTHSTAQRRPTGPSTDPSAI
jgi:AcrR family transcriptional regulator